MFSIIPPTAPTPIPRANNSFASFPSPDEQQSFSARKDHAGSPLHPRSIDSNLPSAASPPPFCVQHRSAVVASCPLGETREERLSSSASTGTRISFGAAAVAAVYGGTVWIVDSLRDSRRDDKLSSGYLRNIRSGRGEKGSRIWCRTRMVVASLRVRI